MMKDSNDLVNWRRSKVAEYLAKGYSQVEIAKTLKVSEPTISRDVEYLRTEANKAMSEYLQDLPLQHQKARLTVDLILRNSFEMLEKVDDSNEKIDIMKLILSATQIRLSFLADATALNKTLEHSNSLRQQIEKLKKTEKPKPVYEVVQVIDDNGNKVRQARKLTKKKQKDSEIIV